MEHHDHVMQDYFHGVLPEIYRQQDRFYSPRSEQIAYAQMVHGTFDAAYQEQQKENGACAILPVEAETGTGKSLGFLIPLLDRVAQDRLAGLGNRAAVATFTTQLRNQLVAKDLPTAIAAVKRYRGVSLTSSSYYGSNSYLSMSALKDLHADHKNASPRDREIAGVLMNQMLKYPDFALIEDARDFLCLEEDQPIFSVLSDRELGCTWKEAKDIQAYLDMRKAVQSADLILISHAAMLYNVKSWFSMLDGGDSAHWIRYAVFDEAHRLPDAAESMMRNTQSIRGMAQSLLEANTAFGPIPGVPEAVSALRNCATVLKEAFPEGQGETHHLVNLGLSEIIPGMGRTVRATLTQQLDWSQTIRVMQALLRSGEEQVRDGLKKRKEASQFSGGESSVDLSSLHAQIDLLVDLDNTLRFLSDFMDVLDPKSRNLYQWVGSLSWSAEAHLPSLELITTHPGRMTARYWRHYPSKGKPEDVKPSRLFGAVLTSATLPHLPDVGIFNPVDAAKIQEGWQVPPRLMIPDIADVPRFAPEKFGALSFVLSGPSEPAMTDVPVAGRYVNPEWEKTHLFPMMTQMLHVALRDFAAEKEAGDDVRGVMVLTPSGSDIPEMMAHLSAQISLKEQHSAIWINQTGRPLKNAIREFEIALIERRAMPVLFTAGGWEGVDLPGQIAHLFITRLPYPPVDQVRKDALMEKYASDYVYYLQRSMREHTVRSKLCQGIGRLIRQVDDHGTVWLGDARFGLVEELIALSRMHRVKNVLKHQTPDYLLRAIPERFQIRLEEADFFDARRGMYALSDVLADSLVG